MEYYILLSIINDPCGFGRFVNVCVLCVFVCLCVCVCVCLCVKPAASFDEKPCDLVECDQYLPSY